MKGYPVPGAAVEALGIMSTMIDSDLMSNGEVHITVQASPSNIKLVEKLAFAKRIPVLVISPSLARVPVTVCNWRSRPVGRLFDTDEQVMIEHAVDDYYVRSDACGFQRTLTSRRNRI